MRANHASVKKHVWLHCSNAVWRTLPNPEDEKPEMELVRKFIASTPRKELRKIMVLKG